MPSLAPQRFLETRLFTTGGRKVAFYTLAHSMYTFLAGGFEIALIIRLTGSIERIVFLNLAMFILLYLAFFAGTVLLRSGKVSRGFRLDLGIQTLACLYMLVNFSRLGNSLVLAGFFVLKGLSEGTFWSTRHSALIHAVHDSKRDSWSLKLLTITIILSVILPVVSGFVISHLDLPMAPEPGTTILPAGYWPVYALGACLALGALIISPSLRIPPQKLTVRASFGLVRKPGKGDFMAFLACGTIANFCAVTAIGILNFNVLKTEFRLGIFASGIALASAGFFFAIQRLRRRHHLPRLRMVLAGTSGDVASRLVYSCFYSLPGLIGKSLLDSFIVPLRAIFGDNINRRRTELLARNHGLSVAEVLLFQESVLLVARVSICLALIIVLNLVQGDPVSVARVLLMVFTGYGFVDFLLLRRVEKGNRRMAAEAPSEPSS